MEKQPVRLVDCSKAIMEVTLGSGRRIQKAYRSSAWVPWMSKRDLEDLGITCTGLDLGGRNPGARVRPVALDVVDRWLDMEKPSEVRGLGSGRVELDEWWNANTLACDLLSYVRKSAGEGRGGLMHEHTKWESRLEFFPVLQLRDKKMWSDVEDILQRTDGLCNTTAVVTQRFRLVDNALTWVELLAFLNLTVLRVSDNVHLDGNSVPVTMISMGDCNVRVIHGYVDPFTKKITLQISPIMTFEKPGEYLSKKWKTVIAWLLAEPM